MTDDDEKRDRSLRQRVFEGAPADRGAACGAGTLIEKPAGPGFCSADIQTILELLEDEGTVIRTSEMRGGQPVFVLTKKGEDEQDMPRPIARYKFALAQLADAMAAIPLADLPLYLRDLQAAVIYRNPTIQQALDAHANEEFLGSILDCKRVDEQRFPSGRWQGSETPGPFWRGCNARRQRVLQRARGDAQDAPCRFPNCDCRSAARPHDL